MQEPRVSAAISIIGCPDYVELMSDRARLTKLPSFIQSHPAGASFIGSKDFPIALMNAVEKYDPARRIFKSTPSSDVSDFFKREPSLQEQDSLRSFMHQAFCGKRLLNMSGGSDQLVPYKCSDPFLRWVERVLGPGGPFSENEFTFEDIVFEGIGHAMSPDMAKAVDRFVVETLSESRRLDCKKVSKI